MPGFSGVLVPRNIGRSINFNTLKNKGLKCLILRQKWRHYFKYLKIKDLNVKFLLNLRS
jgi:hypothetical protein